MVTPPPGGFDSKGGKVLFDFVRYQFATFFKEVTLIGDFHDLDICRNAVSRQVSAEFFYIGDIVIFLRSTAALFDEFFEVHFGGLTADCNVDLALRDDVIGNLVILTSGHASFFQQITGKEVVNI
ncbi:MAG: hypothetical protein ACOCYT_00380 [Chloroflexota bacterium]